MLTKSVIYVQCTRAFKVSFEAYKIEIFGECCVEAEIFRKGP